MILDQNQIAELLSIIENNTNIFIATNIGHEFLSDVEINNLKNIGIDPNVLYNENYDFIKQSFYFGLVSDALKADAKKINFDDLKKHFSTGKHIPLTQVEKFTVSSIKKQFLGDIKANKGRIFNDVNGIIANNEKMNRSAYEKIIRDETESGYLDQKTTSQIARDLGRKTGDWSRNFHRIIEYNSHYAFNEGRLSAYEREDETQKVWFNVYDGACKHCIKLYLTNGLGSQPILFTISELKSNGSNIGKKVDDWKATIGPIHPYCRCTINKLPKGYMWNEEKKKFELKQEIVIEGRKPIKFTVNINGVEKEYFV